MKDKIHFYWTLFTTENTWNLLVSRKHDDNICRLSKVNFIQIIFSFCICNKIYTNQQLAKNKRAKIIQTILTLLLLMYCIKLICVCIHTAFFVFFYFYLEVTCEQNLLLKCIKICSSSLKSCTISEKSHVLIKNYAKEHRQIGQMLNGNPRCEWVSRKWGEMYHYISCSPINNV